VCEKLATYDRNRRLFRKRYIRDRNVVAIWNVSRLNRWFRWPWVTLRCGRWEAKLFRQIFVTLVPFDLTTKQIRPVTRVGRGVFIGSVTPSIQAIPNFGGSTSFDVTTKFGGDNMTKGVSATLLHLHKCVARFVSDSWVSCFFHSATLPAGALHDRRQFWVLIFCCCIY